MAGRIKIGLGIAASALVILIGAFFVTHFKGQRPQGLDSGQGTLDGEVFIVTQGAQNIKLGLVEVRVLPYEATKNSVAKTRLAVDQQLASLKSKLDAARRVVATTTANANAANRAYSAAAESSESDFEKAEKAQDAAFDRMTAAHDKDADARQAYYDIEGQIEGWTPGPTYFANLPTPLSSTETDADGKFSVRIDRNATVVLAAHASRRIPDKTEQYYWLVAVSLDGQLTKRIFLSNDNVITFESKDSPIHVAR